VKKSEDSKRIELEVEILEDCKKAKEMKGAERMATVTE